MLLLAGLWLSKGQIRNHSYSTEDRCSWRQNEEGWFRSQTPPLATSLPPHCTSRSGSWPMASGINVCHSSYQSDGSGNPPLTPAGKTQVGREDCPLSLLAIQVTTTGKNGANFPRGAKTRQRPSPPTAWRPGPASPGPFCGLNI